MNEPTGKQYKHILQLIDDQNPSREQVGFLEKSGILSILVNADFTKIDKGKIVEGCGYNVPPLRGNTFGLKVDGKNRRFRFIPLNDRITLREAISEILRFGFRLADCKCLNAFMSKYKVADGKRLICLPVGVNECLTLEGECGKKWKKFHCTAGDMGETPHTISGHEWFVEVVA